MALPFPEPVERVRKPRLHHPLDAIVTFTWNATMVMFGWAALDAGFLLGTSSAADPDDRWTAMVPLTFIDNEWHGYDHGRHLAFVARYRPKYTTVRDYLSPRAAKAAGVTYYSLDQILAWADELSEYAANVIVIPKEPVVDEIPERFMLGYSVPSTYGGTPLPIEMFTGRRLHLLGGSWRRQLPLLRKMGDDIVSIDFNAAHLAAKNGSVILPNGDSKPLEDITAPYRPANKIATCMVMSLGMISAALAEFTPTFAATPDSRGARYGIATADFAPEGEAERV